MRKQETKSWPSLGLDPIVQTQTKLYLDTRIHRLYFCYFNKFFKVGLKMCKPIHSQLLMNFTGLHGLSEGACMTHSKGDKVAGTRH